jgi:hypothetical protein
MILWIGFQGYSFRWLATVLRLFNAPLALPRPDACFLEESLDEKKWQRRWPNGVLGEPVALLVKSCRLGKRSAFATCAGIGKLYKRKREKPRQAALRFDGAECCDVDLVLRAGVPPSLYLSTLLVTPVNTSSKLCLTTFAAVFPSAET